MLGFVEPALLLVFGGQRHEAALGRERETLLERNVGLCPATDRGERLAEREPGILDRVMALLLPDLVAVRAIERLFPMTTREKLRGSAALAVGMARDAMGGTQ